MKVNPDDISHAKRFKRIGLGTYTLAGRTSEVCLQAIELGYRYLDTASLYQNEAAVASAIRESGVPREEIFLCTKLLKKDIEQGRIPEAVENALRIFGSIDLLLLHAPTSNFEEAWDQLQELRGSEIRQIGVSNFARSHLAALNGQLPAANQIEISPFLQRRELVAHCRESDIELVSHSALTKARKFSHPVIQAIAAEYETSPASVLLAWSLKKVDTALVRTQNLQHLKEDLAAGKLALGQEAMAQLDELESGFATHPQHIS